MVVGVTPRTALIALRVQPNSATICALLNDVNDFRIGIVENKNQYNAKNDQPHVTRYGH